jgi:hypothetical protein
MGRSGAAPLRGEDSAKGLLAGCWFGGWAAAVKAAASCRTPKGGGLGGHFEEEVEG